MKSKSPRNTLPVPLLVVLLLSACVEGGPSQSEPNASEAETLESPAKPRQKEALSVEPSEPESTDDHPRVSKTVAAMWWNRPEPAKRMGLTTDQRAQMDAVCRSFLIQRAEGTAEQEIRSRISESLKQGDWDTSREEARRLGDSARRNLIGQIDLTVDVLSLLDDEQLQRLAEKYPALLTGRWIARGLNRANNRAQGTRARQEAAQTD